ncbi:hypothetical protein [Brucella oryzae]|nr:hypothetical protein [Brucella oryzae]
MAENRIIFRKVSDGEINASLSLNPEKHGMPSMSPEIYEKLQD